jgi:predicted  nucleic acid-binding Zn-ribbon protein
MENEPPKAETEIEMLARLVKDGFDRMDKGFEAMHAGFANTDERFAAVDERFTDVNKRIDNLNYKVDQLDAKVDAHRQETKDGFAGIHRVIGGMSHTLADHEERIKALEGE